MTNTEKRNIELGKEQDRQLNKITINIINIKEGKR